MNYQAPIKNNVVTINIVLSFNDWICKEKYICTILLVIINTFKETCECSTEWVEYFRY